MHLVKQWAMFLSAWAPFAQAGELEAARFQLSTAPAVAFIWGVNQHLKDLSHSLSLYNSAFRINKINL